MAVENLVPIVPLLLLLTATRAQYVRQILIRPTVDQNSVRASVQTLAGPTKGVRRAGYKNAFGGSARFRNPTGIAADGNTIFVADTHNHVIRTVKGGSTSTFAGSGEPGFADGIGGDAQFYNPSAVAIGPNGEVYVADTGNHAVRRITPDATVATLFAGRSYAIAEARSGQPPLGFWNPQVGSGHHARTAAPALPRRPAPRPLAITRTCAHTARTSCAPAARAAPHLPHHPRI
jgi:hypothetical protein